MNKGKRSSKVSNSKLKEFLGSSRAEPSSNCLLIFKKDAGKTDRVEFRLGLERVVEVKNPKQGIIPHDMIHFAVEQTFPFEGFIQLVFKGYDPNKVMEVLHGFAPILPGPYPQTAWMAESLVESFQAALWSGSASFSDFEYAYGKACEARKVSPQSITEADFTKCLEMIRRLSSQWPGIREGQALELPFKPRFPR